VKLYHYACRHSVNGILESRGELRPNPETGWQKKVQSFVFPVVWLTDVDIRSRDDAALVGLAQLGGDITGCLRVEFRFIVPNVGVLPWARWAEDNADPVVRRLLEESPGADPARWFVSPGPVRGSRLDQRYRVAAPQ
jgi:hypothetical protein